MTTYLAIDAHYWGKGDTIGRARKMKARHGGDVSEGVVLRMPEGATQIDVDEMGRVWWRWADDAPDRDAQPEQVWPRERTAEGS